MSLHPPQTPPRQTSGRLQLPASIQRLGDVTYSYTLASDVDHSGGALSETIALAVTDAQGDTETGGLKIAIVDDLPSAQNDTDTAINVGGNPSSVATGNIVTGNDTGSPDPDTLDGIGDTIGADENSAPSQGSCPERAAS